MKGKQRYLFPGMDPWLEHPAIWPDVHHRLITYLADALADQIAPNYVARHGERVVVEPAGREVAPDVVVSRRPREGRGGTAVLDEPEPLIVKLPELYIREPFLEIRDRRSRNRVVTVIEVLSPSNKRSGTDSRRKYLEKQAEVLSADVSLMEIDLLRGGEHTVALPDECRAGLGEFHYCVVTRRAGRHDEAEVYRVLLQQRLPVLRVPLVSPDPDARVELQPLIQRIYEVGGYSGDLDYSRPPTPPLAEEDMDWARKVVRPKSRGR